MLLYSFLLLLFVYSLSMKRVFIWLQLFTRFRRRATIGILTCMKFSIGISYTHLYLSLFTRFRTTRICLSIFTYFRKRALVYPRSKKQATSRLELICLLAFIHASLFEFVSHLRRNATSRLEFHTGVFTWVHLSSITFICLLTFDETRFYLTSVVYSFSKTRDDWNSHVYEILDWNFIHASLLEFVYSLSNNAYLFEYFHLL